mmetsp:Transcript_36695/g.88442  ORF Transcript_36695/g.88442 Transcript_36695/m.88442 type:complete len:80 (+) Transcript_36695:1063-1302(+)
MASVILLLPTGVPYLEDNGSAAGEEEGAALAGPPLPCALALLEKNLVLVNIKGRCPTDGRITRVEADLEVALEAALEAA